MRVILKHNKVDEEQDQLVRFYDPKLGYPEVEVLVDINWFKRNGKPETVAVDIRPHRLEGK